MMRTEFETNRNAGEFQSLVRFLSRSTQAVVRTRNAALDFDRQLDEGLRAVRSGGSGLGAAVIGRPLTGAMHGWARRPRLRCLLPPPSLSAHTRRGWGWARGWFDTRLPNALGVRCAGVLLPQWMSG
eukprot:COSAG01_NODE_3244_length_6360_cov_4.915988_2_plen_127_part_00